MTPLAARPAGSASTSSQVVMVGIGPETLALDASFVREIIDPIPVTPVAGAPAHLSSVLNVRGNVVPLADIRERFGVPRTADTSDTRFVVIELPIDGDPVTFALVADRVHEVTEITRDTAQPLPRIGIAWSPEFVSAIVTWRDQFVIVPNMTAVLA